MATETQNARHSHEHPHEHNHGNGQHPQGPRQEAVNPEDRPLSHNPRTSELPAYIMNFLKEIEDERGEACPDDVIEDLKSKIAAGDDIRVEHMKICGNKDCKEHQGKNGIAEVVNKIIAGLQGDLVKLAKDRQAKKAEQEKADQEKKRGKHFVGSTNCECCGVGKATRVVMNHTGQSFDEVIAKVQAGQTFVKAVCETCFQVTKKVIGDFLATAMTAPCPLCVPYPNPEGEPLPTWAALCDTHFHFAQIVKNS